MTSLLSPASLTAAEKTVLIIKFEDAEHSELASKLYRKVVTKISEHMENAGFRTLKDDKRLHQNPEFQSSHTDSNLLAKIREENGTNIDFVAIVQILANTVLLQEGTRIEVEINGRMLNVSNGDVLARFDLSVPNTLNAPPACDRKCIIQLLEDNTAFLADSLGQVLAKRLQNSQ
ncbi:MAG: hypothetical protein JKX94_07595 [Sneathiella sp.]|nr:hypothetical protein [Sneathiella sp.]